jgi:CBS domain-containing protein
MEHADRLTEIVEQLRANKDVPSLTVREFLSWFGAQRRGYAISEKIRQALRNAKLQTEPDFESAYLDSSICFSLASEPLGETVVVVQPVELPLSASAPKIFRTSESYADPISRLSKLKAANTKPVSVTPNTTIQEAVTIMLMHDFSQLPVMTGERDVKGIVSWTSIGTRLGLGKDGTSVREFMETHQEIRAEASLFQAIPIIVTYQYVLIRGSDNRITGIVTASDLSLQFYQLAEPFLLLGEIENHIRRIIEKNFSLAELVSVQDPADNQRKVECVADLTFGEYIRLLEHQDRWQQLDLPIDRVIFCKELDRVRVIRNDVMHFDPDGIPSEDLEHLRTFNRFLQRLHGIGVP